MRSADGERKEKLMKQNMKRSLSLLLALTMALTLLLPTAWAETGESQIGKITFSVETKTIDGAYLVAPMEEELYENDTVYTILERVAKEKNIEVVNATGSYVTKIGAYAEMAYGSESGWKIAVNNDHTTWPLPTLKSGDSIRFCYTYKTNGYDIDLIDLIGDLEAKVTEASIYEGENSETVYAVMEEAAEKLLEIEAYTSNRDYLDHVNIYGSGSEAEKISLLIRKLDCALSGGKYVPATGAALSVSGSPEHYYVGRTYQFSASIEPQNATISEGAWKVVETTGAGTITSKGRFTPTKAGFVVLQYWHPDASNGVLATKLITVESSPAQVKMPELLKNIAASYVEASGDWQVMDMGAYEKLGLSAAKLSEKARQNYINRTIAALAKGGGTDQAYAKGILGLTAIGVDAAKLYPVNSNTPFSAVEGLNKTTQSSSAWSAPYTLAAYNQRKNGAASPYEQALVSALLAAQKEDGSWDEFGTIDTTANVIAGLSFYRGEARVDTAICKAVDYLSAKQKDSGAFDDGQMGQYAAGINANSTAMVIIGLCAAGIHPDKDPRFIKNGHSVLDGLLSFALADHSGFGHQDNVAFNSGSTEQGFRALIAAEQVMKTGKAYNIYDFSSNAVQPGRATGTGEVEKPTEPDTERTITVSFALKSDTNYWVSPKSVTVKEGSTVYHVFTAALENTGITYEGAETGYVTSVTKDGKTLGEFTNGSNSGWLYKVNGKLPDVGMTDYKVSGGDSVLWYYTTDWAADPDAGHYQPAEEQVTTTTTVNRDGTVTVTVKKGKETLDTVRGGVQVKLPNRDGLGDVVVLVDEQGRETVVTKSLVDGKTAYALLPGTCTVKIVDNGKDFLDVHESAWYAGAVDFVSGHDLYNGTGAGLFSPDTVMSRAMLASVLYRLESAPEAAEHLLDGFADGTAVAAWAREGMSWAVEEKILQGTDGGRLAADGPITREQLAVMVYRYAQVCGMDLKVSAAADLSAQGVSPWAETAMAWAVDKGILEGKDGGRLAPRDPASRAEVAAILQRLVAEMVC